jgi:hypothetical protein
VNRPVPTRTLRFCNVIQHASERKQKFPICRWLTNSSNSLVDRSTNLIAKDREEYRQAGAAEKQVTRPALAAPLVRRGNRRPAFLFATTTDRRLRVAERRLGSSSK